MIFHILNRFTSLTMLLCICGSAMADPLTSLMVPYSAQRDFGLVCKIGDKTTYLIRKDSYENNDRVARNISLTDISAGRVAISFLHGFTTADKAATYLTATNESCTSFEQ